MVIWIHQDGVWTSLPLAAPLAFSVAAPGVPGTTTDTEASRVRLVPFPHHGSRRAALVSRPGIGLTLNGFPALGVEVVRHGDAIAFAGCRLAFSAFAPSEPAPFVPDGAETRCALCKAVLVAGEIVLRCGACGAPHHHRDDLPCSTYDETCGGCDRRRDETAWTPAATDDEETRHADR